MRQPRILGLGGAALLIAGLIGCVDEATPSPTASSASALTGKCKMTVHANYPGEDMWITSFHATAVCGGPGAGQEIDEGETSNGELVLENLKCDCQSVTVESLDVFGGQATVEFTPSRDLATDDFVDVEVPLPW